MIIKKLAKLVKKAHYLGITSTINERSQQWLGGNWGLYDISDLPSITYGQACAMFDFNAKTIDNTWDDSDGACILAQKVKTACKFRRFEADEIEIHSTFFGDEEMKVVVDKDQTTFAFIPAELLSPIVETELYTKGAYSGRGRCYISACIQRFTVGCNDSVTSYSERNGGLLAGIADQDIQLHEPLSEYFGS